MIRGRSLPSWRDLGWAAVPLGLRRLGHDGYSVVTAPSAAAFVEIHLVSANSSGTVWLDNVAFQ
ncbi:MAG: hypothetical protein HY329_20055 [Chloroflexi bacterium]|nr:hypothetical protein [Chloroflexota bacterium]